MPNIMIRERAASSVGRRSFSSPGKYCNERAKQTQLWSEAADMSACARSSARVVARCESMCKGPRVSGYVYRPLREVWASTPTRTSPRAVVAITCGAEAANHTVGYIVDLKASVTQYFLPSPRACLRMTKKFKLHFFGPVRSLRCPVSNRPT